MGKSFREQFAVKAFALQHDKPNDFVISSWQRSNSPVPLLVMRLALAAVTVATWLWSLLDDEVTGFWFIYLTNWGLMLLTLSTCCAVLVSLSALCIRFPDEYSTPWFIRVYWLIYNIATPTAFLITIFYWSILYNSETETSARAFWLDVATHGGNSAVMLLELALCRTPSRFLHFYQPFGFGVWYVVFTAIYYGAGGLDPEGNGYVYDVLDWSAPGPAMAVVGGTAAGLLLLHALVVTAALLRTSLSSACVRTKGHDLPSVPDYPSDPVGAAA